ncbi:MAG: hypothetical protein HAW62_05845 [Endozoicomonadaceae bacterium]|nr:hypothetical protein [Endozoicomonadaceae bacterium]
MQAQILNVNTDNKVDPTYKEVISESDILIGTLAILRSYLSIEVAEFAELFISGATISTIILLMASCIPKTVLNSKIGQTPALFINMASLASGMLPSVTIEAISKYIQYLPFITQMHDFLLKYNKVVTKADIKKLNNQFNIDYQTAASYVDVYDLDAQTVLHTLWHQRLEHNLSSASQDTNTMTYWIKMALSYFPIQNYIGTLMTFSIAYFFSKQEIKAIPILLLMITSATIQSLIQKTFQMTDSELYGDLHQLQDTKKYYQQNQIWLQFLSKKNNIRDLEKSLKDKK